MSVPRVKIRKPVRNPSENRSNLIKSRDGEGSVPATRKPAL